MQALLDQTAILAAKLNDLLGRQLYSPRLSRKEPVLDFDSKTFSEEKKAAFTSLETQYVSTQKYGWETLYLRAGDPDYIARVRNELHADIKDAGCPVGFLEEPHTLKRSALVDVELPYATDGRFILFKHTFTDIVGYESRPGGKGTVLVPRYTYPPVYTLHELCKACDAKRTTRTCSLAPTDRLVADSESGQTVPARILIDSVVTSAKAIYPEMKDMTEESVLYAPAEARARLSALCTKHKQYIALANEAPPRYSATDVLTHLLGGCGWFRD